MELAKGGASDAVMEGAFGAMMRKIGLGVLYLALALGANPGLGGPDAAAALRDGDMKKLSFTQSDQVRDAVFLDAADVEVPLDQWRGKWVVLNFWATWCAPCRHEMPSLARLQVAMPEIAVLPVATGRNSVTGITKFFAEAGVTGLPVLRDPKSVLAREMAVMGLPVTVILDPQGREVARLIGDAEWDSATAQAVLTALIAEEPAP